MLIQGQEYTPLEALWTFNPVTRHEIHGSLEGPLESLWEAVEKHRAHLMEKLNARNLAGLVRLAVKYGLVDRNDV